MKIQLKPFLSISTAVFRAGEQGRFWYAVLGGSLEVRYHAPDTENKVCTIFLLAAISASLSLSLSLFSCRPNLLFGLIQNDSLRNEENEIPCLALNQLTHRSVALA